MLGATQKQFEVFEVAGKIFGECWEMLGKLQEFLELKISILNFKSEMLNNNLLWKQFVCQVLSFHYIEENFDYK